MTESYYESQANADLGRKLPSGEQYEQVFLKATVDSFQKFSVELDGNLAESSSEVLYLDCFCPIL